jgi:hypothetical protein
MATLADDLRKTKREAIHNELKENADLLRFFVKSTLLEALQEAVKHGSEYAPVTAPKAIRHLFEMPCYGSRWDMEDEKSAYQPVWEELRTWAASEGLYIGYAGAASTNNNDRPSSEWEWQAFLGLRNVREPRPEPEPIAIPDIKPALLKSPFFWGGVMMAVVSFIFILNQ